MSFVLFVFFWKMRFSIDIYQMNVYSCWAGRVVGLRVSYAQEIVFIFSETVLNDKELCGPCILKLWILS